MSSFKYAHFADLHIGSWREENLRELSTQTFLKAMDACREQQVDFILFSGDIFNTPLPAIESLKMITKKLKEIHDRGIPLYVIPGSHDFSPSGKTMIDVLENAGLLVNVCKGQVVEGALQLRFTTDQKTGAKLTGMMGKKGMLDRVYYEHLDREALEKEPGYKIFLFHTALSELKPDHLEEMEAYPLSLLPKGFNYYAGGHVHHRSQIEPEGYGLMTYPGALFPNNFAELEKYSHGGYYVITVNGTQQSIEWLPVKVREHVPIGINSHHQTPDEIMSQVRQELRDKIIDGALVTLRLSGTLTGGRLTDRHWNELMQELSHRGAYCILRNTNKLTTEEHEEIKLEASSPEQVEERLIREHLQQVKTFSAEEELRLTKELLTILNTERKEGETVNDFEERVISETEEVVKKRS